MIFYNLTVEDPIPLNIFRVEYILKFIEGETEDDRLNFLTEIKLLKTGGNLL